MMKSDSTAKAGLLQPLEIPSRKWAHVTTDLVTTLLESNGFIAFVVFVDKLAKMVHLAGYKKRLQPWNMPRSSLTMSSNYTVSFFEVIISDQDSQFTGKFWRPLFDLLRTDLQFNTAFHLQIDG